ncbi:MAG: hypothetical protein M3R43_12020, partial [Acidobacteriota bacterium]|nr:hypothetical protein [Acidobacteriota bacterium]
SWARKKATKRQPRAKNNKKRTANNEKKDAKMNFHQKKIIFPQPVKPFDFIVFAVRLKPYPTVHRMVP